MKSLVGLITLTVLSALTIAATCESAQLFDPWDGSSPVPYDYGDASGDTPYGFSSWEDYSGFTRTIPVHPPCSGNPNIPGLCIAGTSPSFDILAADTDGDGEVLVTPVDIVQPDGTAAQIIGEVPSGSELTFNDDGTVTVVLP